MTPLPTLPALPSPPQWQVRQAKALTLVRCARHRDADATVQCDRCHQKWCKFCVKSGDERGTRWWLCDCGGRCEALPEPEAVVRARQGTFGSWLIDAFRYPLRGAGRGQMVIATLCVFVVAKLWGEPLAVFAGALIGGGGGASLVFRLVVISALVLVALSGYLVGYMQLVIRKTADGQDDPPGFPDFVSFRESMLAPAARMVTLLLLAFAPALALLALGGYWPILGVVLALGGAAYFPMALTALAVVDDDWDGLDPRRVFRSIGTVARPYAFATALFFASLGLMVGGSFWLADLPYVGTLFRSFGIVYLTTVSARVLGVTYRHHAKELGWV